MTTLKIKQAMIVGAALMQFNFLHAQTSSVQKVKFERFSGRTSYISNNHDAYIYASDNSDDKNSYPFRDTDLGHLIIQPRTSSARDIIFATGSGTPKVRMIVEGDGHVGIGTTNPQHMLDVNGKAVINDLVVDNKITTKNIEVNTSSTVGLQVNGSGSSYAGIYANATKVGANPFFGYKVAGSIKGWTDINDNGSWRLMLGGTARMWVTSSGNMTVDGKISAEEIEVKDIGADYVFSEDYKLMPLSELEAFVKTEKHLPGIAPASETEKGVELAQFSEKLLEKTEELTLHIIEQQKQIEELKMQLKEMKK